MESKAKVLGHALHPILIVFPLGLLMTSVVFDAFHLRKKDDDKDSDNAKIANALIGAGVLSGLMAAVPGIIDWLAIPNNTRAKRIGFWHAVGNVTQLLLFGLSWMRRRDDPSHPDKAALSLSVAGLVIGNGAAWLGGELVHRLGVSVDDEAGLDAPNSLLQH